ncbi:hypothetical protein QMO14_21540 [Variovorax sp. CAN2819]|uniref:hypothetical protein n=1 Tax=Variovorax sp. CAN15 TaxID=3046727 RepID=UPI00264A1C6D|nr:hypothetical protein [Variovorax sp. CAN15]MDN6886177.1 hypothetical protein [Variovorax sp. CAN15]
MAHSFSALRCRICNEEINSILDFNHVPIVDPYASVYKEELISLVGAPVHLGCWANHALWPEVARLAVADTRDAYKSGQVLKNNGEYTGAWLRFPKGSPIGVGTMVLPRSAYIYNDMFAENVKGGYIAGSAEDITQIAKFLESLPLEDCKEIYITTFESEDSGPTTIKLDCNEDRALLSLSGESDRLRANIYLGDARLFLGRN